MDWYYIVLIVIGALIINFSLFCYVCYIKTFYSPNKKQKTDEIILPNDPLYIKHKDHIIESIINARKLSFQQMEIKSFDGLTLRGKFYEFEKNAPIEIMFHGYRGNGERDMSAGITRAALCGHSALVVDQRASGASDGHIISFGINERHDCLAWAKMVSQKFGPDIPIILTGISMGASTVLMTSAMDLPKNVIAVLADCGFNSASDIIKKVISDMKLPVGFCYFGVKLGAKIFGRFDIEETSPYQAVQSAKVPIIFFHGENDDFVPCYMSQKLYDVCSSEKVFVTIKNAEHGVSYLINPDEYVKEARNFFNKVENK